MPLRWVGRINQAETGAGQFRAGRVVTATPDEARSPKAGDHRTTEGKQTMTTETTEYDKQAQTFLDTHGMTIRITHKGDRCPPWRDGRTASRFGACACCGTVHGDRYRVTICEPGSGRGRLAFDFWGSYADRQNAEHPTAYDVLACISGDAYAPDTFAEFCCAYGYDEDSRGSFATFKRVDRFAGRLREFFTDEEREELAEIN